MPADNRSQLVGAMGEWLAAEPDGTNEADRRQVSALILSGSLLGVGSRDLDAPELAELEPPEQRLVSVVRAWAFPDEPSPDQLEPAVTPAVPGAFAAAISTPHDEAAQQVLDLGLSTSAGELSDDGSFTELKFFDMPDDVADIDEDGDEEISDVDVDDVFDDEDSVDVEDVAEGEDVVEGEDEVDHGEDAEDVADVEDEVDDAADVEDVADVEDEVDDAADVEDDVDEVQDAEDIADVEDEVDDGEVDDAAGVDDVADVEDEVDDDEDVADVEADETSDSSLPTPRASVLAGVWRNESFWWIVAFIALVLLVIRRLL